MSDLYLFPDDHVGIKAYVSVRGHTKSVPKFKTYRGNDGYNYLRPDFGGDWSGLGTGSTFILPDKAGYVSPIDRKFYEGRAAHREHCARHDVVEAGDMRMGEFGDRDRAPMPDLKSDLRRAYSEVNLRTRT